MPASPTTDPHFRNKLTRDLNQEDAKMASTDSTVPSTTTGDSAGAHAGADVANKAKSVVKGTHVRDTTSLCNDYRLMSPGNWRSNTRQRQRGPRFGKRRHGNRAEE